MASNGPAPSMKKRESSGSREGDQLIITPLGAGNEVGRSCVFMSYKNKTVLFDCGIHPAYSGMAALPYFDEIDPSTIDVLLVTHFHLDHAASLPYFLEKTTFKGRVFMTHATKAIYRLILSDYVKVSKGSVEDMLYNEQDIIQSMDKIEVIDFHQTLEVNGIRFWCYTAGHVLGAAMFMVDIAGVRVLYTGDYSREEDRHLRAAELPQFSPDVCVIESTYGVQLHQPRVVREKRFTDVIHNTVAQGGRVLIPAFALGRAQELLLILDEYWSAHPELHNIPIYYASPLAKRCMAVYQTYINAMNERVRAQFEVSNPFDFKHISSLKSIENFDDVGPSVVMASPSGLQSGLSRQLFDMWCQDKKNACVIPGYVVEGTLAKTIINEPKDVTLSNGLTVPLNMQVCEHVNGLLVKKGFTYQIIAPEDLHIFTQLSTGNIAQRISVPYEGAFSVIRHRLKQIYESVEPLGDPTESPTALLVHDRVTVKQENTKCVSIQWSTDPISDMVSDSVVTVILNINRGIARVGVMGEGVTEEEMERTAEKVVLALLNSLFGDVKRVAGEEGKMVVSVDGVVATVDSKSGVVECENEGLKQRLRTALRRIKSAVKPIPLQKISPFCYLERKL
ncbi:hypothetical protein AMTRI_Chr03g144320 [Amborella trichopoda]